MLIAFGLPSFVLGYVSGRPGVSAKIRWKVASNALQLYTDRENRAKQKQRNSTVQQSDPTTSRADRVLQIVESILFCGHYQTL